MTSTKIDTKQKLDFHRTKQFDLDYFAPTDDGFTTNTQAQHAQVEAYYKERAEKKKNVVSKDPDVLKFTKEYQEGASLEAAPKKFRTTKERGTKDSINQLFQTPKTRMDESQNQATFVHHEQKPLDKQFNIIRDRDSEYFECLCRNKHTMRST